MASGANRTARVHWSLEQAVLGLALLAGFPATVALAWIVRGQNYSFEVRWTLAAVVAVVWIGSAIASYQLVTASSISRRTCSGRCTRETTRSGGPGRSRAAPSIS